MEMSSKFTLPLAIGITNKHWVDTVVAHIAYARSKETINSYEYDTSLQALNSLSTRIPEPSFEKFKGKAMLVLPARVGDILSQIPEKYAVLFAQIQVIRDNNSETLKKYYLYRNIIRDVAIRKKEVLQLLNGKVTSVGYQFALVYSNLKVILEGFVTSRRYLETINGGNDLSFFIEDYSVEKLNFIAKQLELFNVSSFSSSNQNWFISSAKDLAQLSKGVIRYIKKFHEKGQADIDNNLLAQAENSIDSILSCSVPEFAIDFETYSSLFIQVNNVFTAVIEIIQAIKFHDDVIEQEVTGINKEKIIIILNQLYASIFDGERKREVFEEVFYEAAEIDNMIYRLAQQINTEYRNSKDPVCCVGFTEGAIILLGKIIPLLNFPLYLVTYKFSFYGDEMSGDLSKEVVIDFDNSKYDGKRVLIFDDILDRGITVKKFLEQARMKTRAIDFKVCMLLVKPNPENVYGEVDFSGSMVSDVWVVGYGFDTNYKHRNADGVGPIKESFKNL
ncbi:hypoxanthine phosphoribosyltransferase [Mycoplasma wenyonii str. Massachusetts]|uniref:Hypoxanthine-guanine phosphoribosyltransferase n=2 Tax=Mycoplasma wenyonii TaxID=65123 RepID=I6Z5N0_MYCWM|nr:hypoxanthine phosphoribosyltransferase [Mycoplasma wenyonii str. Massachusetts]